MTGLKLSHFLAQAGVCSRRKADEFIKAGDVAINGKTNRDVTYRLKEGDKVSFKARPVVMKERIYIILNKPTKVVTTVSDENDRETVVDLVRLKPYVRLFPVGRLDCNTTGVLLMTNDGDIAQKLSHPRFTVEKKYHVALTSALKPEHVEQLRTGVRLADGFFKPDALEPIPNRPDEWFIMLHSGRNRIIRRFFEHVGYTIRKLDRVSYAGLTTRGLARGQWRFLSSKEISQLINLPQQQEEQSR